MCFNFLTHRTKILKCQPTNGTFAFAPTHEANPSAKSKETFFSQRSARKRNLVDLTFRIKNKN
jgi:hypothetical protein